MSARARRWEEKAMTAADASRERRPLRQNQSARVSIVEIDTKVWNAMHAITSSTKHKAKGTQRRLYIQITFDWVKIMSDFKPDCKHGAYTEEPSRADQLHQMLCIIVRIVRNMRHQGVMRVMSVVVRVVVMGGCK